MSHLDIDYVKTMSRNVDWYPVYPLDMGAQSVVGSYGTIGRDMLFVPMGNVSGLGANLQPQAQSLGGKVVNVADEALEVTRLVGGAKVDAFADAGAGAASGTLQYTFTRSSTFKVYCTDLQSTSLGDDALDILRPIGKTLVANNWDTGWRLVIEVIQASNYIFLGTEEAGVTFGVTTDLKALINLDDVVISG
jgi:hypothetical protein